LCEHGRLASLVVAVAIAGLLLAVLVRGNYCLVPSTFLKPDEVGTAETSIYGIALYLESGLEHRAMYDQAIWWYEVALICEWAIATAVGTAVYVVVRRRWERVTQS
jgi:hypothetical protein